MEERKKKVRAKAAKWTVIIDFIFLLILLWNFSKLNIIVLVLEIPIIAFANWVGFTMLEMVFNEYEIQEESKQFAESVLSDEHAVEVIPISTKTYEEFICGLTDIAKFYAVINENDEIEISVKFSNEEDLRYFESLDKSYFSRYYKLPDKTI